MFTADVGTPTVWAARYLPMNGPAPPHRVVHPTDRMANAMPQAIGAQAVDLDRQVIALCGDGGFAMLMGRHLHAQAARVAGQDGGVFHNRSLGFVAMEMKAGGYISDDTDLNDPDFVKIADAIGIEGHPCRQRC